jgi:hypothetical protein
LCPKVTGASHDNLHTSSGYCTGLIESKLIRILGLGNFGSCIGGLMLMLLICGSFGGL